MSDTTYPLLRFLPTVAVAVFNLGWDMIGYQNPALGYVLWMVAALLLLFAAWPWIKRWRPFTLAPEKEYTEQMEKEQEASRPRVTELQDRDVSPQPDELKSLCLHLSKELYEFVTKRQMYSESMRFWHQAQDAETQEEKTRLRVEERKAMPRDEALTLEVYRDSYRERTMAIYDVLARRGWLGPNHRRYFDNPENDTNIQQAARLLEDVGNKL